MDSGTVASVALSASSGPPTYIAYRAGDTERQLSWLDRSGKQIGTVGDPDAAQPVDLELSPDGLSVALRRTTSGNADLWLMEIARGVFRRFTFDAGIDGGPIWSPDGSRIAFSSTRKGFQDLYEKPVTGGGTETALVESSEVKGPDDWSPDGRFLLYTSFSPKTSGDLWVLPFDGDKRPFAVVQTNFSENSGRVSPDGHWIAFNSNESGLSEIYVQPFPGPGNKLQISINGGANARWRRDGREIFYLGSDNRLMAVPVTLPANGQRVEAGSPVALFTLQPGSEYAVAPDGQRFLINTATDSASTPPITVILNWAGRRNF